MRSKREERTERTSVRERRGNTHDCACDKGESAHKHAYMYWDWRRNGLLLSVANLSLSAAAPHVQVAQLCDDADERCETKRLETRKTQEDPV